MRNDRVPARPTDGRAEAPAISSTFLVFALIAGHTMASMAVLVLPAIAPAVARDYGFDASLIGYQISLVSIGMVVSLSLFGNATAKLGACRTNQTGHAMVAGGMLIMLLPWTLCLIAGSLVVGLGYGVLTPSASYLLVRYTPAARRNLFFSLHQVGIPLGGMLAALASPAVAVLAGWRWSVALSVALVCGVIVLMQRGRREWDDDRDSGSPIVTPNPFAGVTAIWRHGTLRLMSVAGGCFSWAQFCTATFAVVACVEALGMSLIVAGTVLTVVQVSSAIGRVFIGWLVDRVRGTASVLAWTAGVLTLACLAALAMSPGLPLPAAYLLFAVLGGASGCWPGAMLAEVGRLAPHGRVSLAISGSLIITNVGKFIGPIVVANVYALSRSYGIAFASVALPAAIAVACLVAAHRRVARTPA
ncbi:MAG: MFS transporter [Burkholderiales bacterium]